MFTQAANGRKIAINYKLVRYVHELPALGEDTARSRIVLHPVNNESSIPECVDVESEPLMPICVDVEEDFDVVLSRLNMVVK
jgi:hypothetical protein